MRKTWGVLLILFPFFFILAVEEGWIFPEQSSWIEPEFELLISFRNLTKMKYFLENPNRSEEIVDDFAIRGKFKSSHLKGTVRLQPWTWTSLKGEFAFEVKPLGEDHGRDEYHLSPWNQELSLPSVFEIDRADMEVGVLSVNGKNLGEFLMARTLNSQAEEKFPDKLWPLEVFSVKKNEFLVEEKKCKDQAIENIDELKTYWQRLKAENNPNDFFEIFWGFICDPSSGHRFWTGQEIHQSSEPLNYPWNSLNERFRFDVE